jgi:hypothetical protein
MMSLPLYLSTQKLNESSSTANDDFRGNLRYAVGFRLCMTPRPTPDNEP